ncbi:MAG: hypothetical protein ACRD27_09850, partial [Terracidiphilus sp.]
MNQKFVQLARQAVVCLVGLAVCATAICLHAAAPKQTGKIRTYYVAADEVNWNYAPSGRDEAMGTPFGPVART